MRASSAWIAIVLAACATAPAAVPADAGADAAAAEPAAPAPAALPVLTPCPSGWREILLPEGVAACEPWSTDAAPSCAEDAIALPGAGCVALDDCPADGWPADLPETGVTYVRAGAIGGDGSRERPLGSARDAIASAAAGSIVALAVGEHTEQIVVRGVDVRGACAARTVVRNASTDPSSAAIGVAPGGTARLSGLRLVGGFRGLWITPGAAAIVHDSIVEGPGGLRVDRGSSLEGERLRITGAPEPDFGQHYAVSLRPGASLALRESSVARGGRGAIGYVRQGSDPPAPTGITVTLADVALLDAATGVGGEIDTIEAERIVVERIALPFLVLPGTRAVLRDVRARDLGPAAAIGDPIGLALAFGEATIERAYVSRMEGSALAALTLDGSPPGRLVARDVVVDDCGGGAQAFTADGSASALVERALAARIAGQGFVASGGALELVDVHAVDLAPFPERGDAIAALAGGSIELDRARIVRPARVALVAASGARIAARDVEIEGPGRGVLVQCGESVGSACPPELPGEIVLERARLRGVTRFAIASAQASIEVRDLDVDGVVGADSDGAGLAVLALGGAVLGARVRVRGAVRHAVAAFEPGGRIALADLEIAGTVPGQCEGCAAPVDGDALACAAAGALELERFDVSGSARAGLALGRGCAEPVLAAGSVHGNAIGIMVDGMVDPTRFGAVRVFANGTDYDAVDLVIEPPSLGL